MRPNEAWHERRARQAAEKQRRPGYVKYVIDIKAVARSFRPSNASQRPVETVAEPVEREGNDDEPKCPVIPPRRCECGAGQRHARECQRCQVIGVDRMWQPFSDVDQ